MRLVFGRYLFLCIIGILLEVIILVAVLIHTFRSTNDLASSVFDFINNQTIILNIYTFLVDWAVTFSFIAVGLILVAFFINFKKYRHNHALKRIHDWAKNAILILSDFRQRDSNLQASPLARYEGIGILIGTLKVHERTMLSAAQAIGGEIDNKTKKSIHLISAIEEKVEEHNDSAYEDLRELQHDLADLMMSTFEHLQS